MAMKTFGQLRDTSPKYYTMGAVRVGAINIQTLVKKGVAYLGTDMVIFRKATIDNREGINSYFMLDRVDPTTDLDDLRQSIITQNRRNKIENASFVRIPGTEKVNVTIKAAAPYIITEAWFKHKTYNLPSGEMLSYTVKEGTECFSCQGGGHALANCPVINEAPVTRKDKRAAKEQVKREKKGSKPSKRR